MKRFILIIFATTLISVSCKSSVDVGAIDNEVVADPDIYEVQDIKPEPENALDISDVSDPDNEAPDIQYEDNEALDEDAGEIKDDADDEIEDEEDFEYACRTYGGYSFDNSWMLPDENWDSWAYIQVVGEVNTSPLKECLYFNYLFNGFEYSWSPLGGEGLRVSNDNNYFDVYGSKRKQYYYEGDYFGRYYKVFYKDTTMNIKFPSSDLSNLKELGSDEVSSNFSFKLKQEFIYEDYASVIPYSHDYKDCTFGVVKVSGGMPVANISGRFEDNTDFDTEEPATMMFRVQLEDDKDKILEYINTRENGSKAVKGDQDFKTYCHCRYYEEDKNLNCYNYDGESEYYEDIKVNY